ncbi:MAG: riboflavin synthase [Planctomycetes bacterium]|nr:riboflavin synthase [Planctomycetota bacterium]
MFTGIVQTMGVVQSVGRRPTGARLVVAAPELARPIADGASICVSGVCLTVVSSDESRIEFDVVPETLSRTTLGGLVPGSRVNLEASLRAGDPMDGHVVQGHVDGIARVRDIRSGGEGQLWTFKADADIMPYVIPKGSIAIDGISLTIARVERDNAFTIALIPTTLRRTTLGSARVGGRVNVETDILARTIVATLRRYRPTESATGDQPGGADPGSGLTIEMLREQGW